MSKVKQDQNAATEEKLRNLIVQVRMLESMVTELQTRIEMVDATINEYSITGMTLDGLKGMKEGTEILVPVGGGSYLKAKMGNVEDVIFNIGAGVTVEQKKAEAKLSVENRISELKKLRTNFDEQLGAALSKMDKTREEIGKITGVKE
ncbi:MAG: prefoldin subunit alpha [Candidatus Bathyarchaeota archaeon]